MKKKQVIIDLKNILVKQLNFKIKKIYLFGSQANGIASEYSDYDILIVLKENYNWKQEKEIYDSAYELMVKHDIIIDIKIISTEELKTTKGKQPYIINAMKSRIYA